MNLSLLNSPRRLRALVNTPGRPAGRDAIGLGAHPSGFINSGETTPVASRCGLPDHPLLAGADAEERTGQEFRAGSASEPSPLLRFHQLGKRYGTLQALGGIDLSVAPGSVLALLGPNGAGKSTLFGCLLGLVRPSAGQIHFRDMPITQAHRRRFGYLAERVALYPQRSAWENGLFFARLKGQPANELERQLQRVGLGAVKDRPIRQYSKGMLQRLGLAIALCGQPEVLVLDEPFNGLDPALLDGLQDILREERQRGATLLISTHTMSAVEPLATHVAILLHGRLAVSSPLEQLRAQPGAEASLERIYHRLARQNHGLEPVDELSL